MSDDENTPLTEIEKRLLGTYRSWAKKGTLVVKLQEKMEKLAAREKIPEYKPVPPARGPPIVSTPQSPMDGSGVASSPPVQNDMWHPMDGCGAALAALPPPPKAEIVTAAIDAVSAPGKRFHHQHALEVELAMRGYFDEPGDMPEALKCPAGGGGK